MTESARARNQVPAGQRVRPRISTEGVAVLYAALEKDMRGRRPTYSSAVKHAIWRICIDAKRNDWPPEWLLVAFKEAVFSLPAVQRVPRGPERDEIVAHLVSLCIEEYYGEPPLGAGAHARSGSA